MLCFRKYLVAKKFMDKKRGGGNITFFRRKFFFFTVPKNFVAEHLSLSFTSGIE